MAEQVPHTQVPNELLEKLISMRVPGESMQILLQIIRKTLGYHKDRVMISCSEFANATGIRKSHIPRAEKKLVDMGLIVVTQKGNETKKTYKVVKDLRKWKPLPKKGTYPIMGTGVPHNGNGNYIEDSNDSNNTLKEKETLKKPYTFTSLRMSVILARGILRNNPSHTKLSNSGWKAAVKRWAGPIEKLHRIDGQPWDDIKQVITWSQGDHFWSGNILSGKKLRKQFDLLRVQAFKPQTAPSTRRDAHLMKSKEELEEWANRRSGNG